MNKRDKLDEWTEKQLEQFEIISEYKNWTFADFSPFKAGADWAIGVMSKRIEVLTQNVKLATAIQKETSERNLWLEVDKKELQAKCEKYEKALRAIGRNAEELNKITNFDTLNAIIDTAKNALTEKWDAEEMMKKVSK